MDNQPQGAAACFRGFTPEESKALDDHLVERHEKPNTSLPALRNRNPAFDTVADVLARWVAAGGLPHDYSHWTGPEWRVALGTINVDRILLEAGITGRAKKLSPDGRLRILKTYEIVGVQRAGPANLVPTFTYAMLWQRIEAIAADAADPMVKAYELDMLRSYLETKWLPGIRRDGKPLAWTSPVGSELLNDFETTRKRLVGARTAASLAPSDRWSVATVQKFNGLMRKAARAAARLVRSGAGAGDTFASVLTRMMAHAGVTAAQLAADAANNGIRLSAYALSTWLKGLILPRLVERGTIVWLAQHLGGDPIALIGLLPHRLKEVRRKDLPAWVVATYREISIEYILPHIPSGFLEWTEDEQRECIAWLIEHFAYSPVAAPPAGRYVLDFSEAPTLEREFNEYVAFRNDALPPSRPDGRLMNRVRSEPPRRFRRRAADLGRLSASSVFVYGHHLRRLFGALCLPPGAPGGGKGLDPRDVCLALLLDPRLLRWFLGWYSSRRAASGPPGAGGGAPERFGNAEMSTANLCRMLFDPEVGFITQRSDLLEALLVDGELKPGLADVIAPAVVERAKADWRSACAVAHEDIERIERSIAKVRGRIKDQWLPILPILEADSPLEQYMLFCLAIRAAMPPTTASPYARARHMRNYLAVRLTLELVFRQGTLRALTWKELFWSATENVWKVRVEAKKFKVPDNDFLQGGVFTQVLEDRDGLYDDLRLYKDVLHKELLKGYVGPDDDVVLPASRHLAGKTRPLVHLRSGMRQTYTPLMTGNEMLALWHLMLRRYGLYNRYTGEGVFAPWTDHDQEPPVTYYVRLHGPHDVRDIVATDYAKAGLPIEVAAERLQDSPETLREHYQRWAPKDRMKRAEKTHNRRIAAVMKRGTEAADEQ